MQNLGYRRESEGYRRPPAEVQMDFRLHRDWCSYPWHWPRVTGIIHAAKLLQSCLTLCDPIDGSPPGSAVPGILQARTLDGLPFPDKVRSNCAGTPVFVLLVLS